MSSEILIVITISIIVVISPYLSKILKMPTTPIEIILGSITAYIGILGTNNIFELLAEIGFLYLMFLAGLEVNINYLLETPKRIIKKSLLYMGILYFLSAIISITINIGNVLFIILPLISVGLIAGLKKEYNNQQWLEYAMIIGIVGEIFSIIMLAIIDSYIMFGFYLDFYLSIFYLILFFIFLIILFTILKNFFWWFPKTKILLMPKDDSQEMDIRLSISLFFITLAIMHHLHLEVAFGAFVAGIFLSTFFQDRKKLFNKLSAFGFGWLIPIFFIYTGTMLDINILLNYSTIIINALWIVLGMILIRIISSFIFREFFSLKEQFLIALSHSMPLTLLIAVTTLAFKNHSIDIIYYNSFILSAILEVIFAIILIKLITFNNKSN